MIIINTTTWAKRRFGGLIDDVPAGWIPYQWKAEDGSGKINKLTEPKCDKKYWKEKSGAIAEMTKTEKTNADALYLQTVDAREKELLIQNEIRNNAIEVLKSEGKLDAAGNLIK